MCSAIAAIIIFVIIVFFFIFFLRMLLLFINFAAIKCYNIKNYYYGKYNFKVLVGS